MSTRRILPQDVLRRIYDYNLDYWGSLDAYIKREGFGWGDRVGPPFVLLDLKYLAERSCRTCPGLLGWGCTCWNVDVPTGSKEINFGQLIEVRKVWRDHDALGPNTNFSRWPKGGHLSINQRRALSILALVDTTWASEARYRMWREADLADLLTMMRVDDNNAKVGRPMQQLKLSS
jgi:hypothetical protein